MNELPVFKPLIEDDELNAAATSLSIGWLGMGASVGEFEAGLEGFLRLTDRRVVAVSTGHAAIHLSLLMCGVQPGDEVITPSFNNIADFQAILAVGAKPVFCDIRDDTLCLDVEKAARLIGPKTKAMIAMDYGSHLADHDAIADLAERHGLRVIHDAAHAFGSMYGGKPVGSFSDICVFSFDPVKTITCIDGGAIVVRSEEEFLALQQMRLIGMGQPPFLMYQNQRAWTYDVSSIGFRYHMANLHAAIGLAQLAKMPRIAATRRTACSLYSSILQGVVPVTVPRSAFEDVVPFIYYIRVPAEHRRPLREHLKENGIDTGIHWQPGHWFSLLQGARRGNLDVTERVASEILTLPLSSSISNAEVSHVAAAVISYFERAS